jgi:hypothetical protein
VIGIHVDVVEIEAEQDRAERVRAFVSDVLAPDGGTVQGIDEAQRHYGRSGGASTGSWARCASCTRFRSARDWFWYSARVRSSSS